MKDKQEKIVVYLGEQEIAVLHAITTGDDSGVPRYLRGSVCMALHDELMPQPHIIPDWLDPAGLKANLTHVVDYAVGMNRPMATAVLKRWLRQFTEEVRLAAQEPARN
jgi:hypothetical protein